MKYKIGLGIAVTFIFIISAFAQGQAVEPESQWLWGEVSSIDIQKNEVVVLYLDYDTDQEKEANISVDEKTTYENVGSLIDIKPHDVISIDYLILPDGRNTAKNINVEKPEVTPDVTIGQ